MAQMEELIQLDDHVIMGRSLDSDLALLPAGVREKEISHFEKELDLLQIAEAITTFFNSSEQQHQMMLQDWSPFLKSDIENKTEPLSVLNNFVEPDQETENALSYLIEGQCDFKALNEIAAKDFALVAMKKRSAETSVETNWGESQGKYRRVKNDKVAGGEKPLAKSLTSKIVMPCNSICSPTHHPKFAFGGKYRRFSYVELQLQCADEE